MAMTATKFFGHFKALNQYVRDTRDASDDLKAKVQAMAAAFRTSYTTESFRQALDKDGPVESELEDRTTSALMALNRDRVTRGTKG